MTSDQLHLRIRKGLHQAAPFISGGDVLQHLHGWREEIYKTPLGLSRLRRGRSCDYQTTSGHGAKQVQSSHVSPEEGCYNVWFVQDRQSHRLYWLHDWDCGLVVWVCAADHLEDEEASRGGQRHDTRYEWRQDAAEHEISSHD